MLSSRPAVRDGLVVGIIAYAAVALFYSAFDLLAARGTLFTVNLLGQAVFKGLRDPAVLQFPIELDLTAIFWYNALHFALSLAIGLIVTRLVQQAEERPTQTPLILLAVVAGGVVTVLIVGYLTPTLRSLLPWWSIVVANVCAVALAGAYLLAKRPGLWRRYVHIAPTPR